MYLGVIVNPLARRNRRARGDRVAELRRIVGPWGEVHETASIEDLGKTLDQLHPRVTHLVGDGGDGALHWLINEIERCESDPERWPTFVPTNGGSVNAVARKARVRGRPDAIIRALAAAAEADRPPPEIRLDTLRLDGETADGAAFHRLCFGLAAGGVGNRFYDMYYGKPDHGRGEVARVIGRSFRDYLASKVGRVAGLQLRVRAVRPDARPSRHRRRGGSDADAPPAARRRHRPADRRAVPAFPEGRKTRRTAFPGRRGQTLEDRRAASRGAHQRHAPGSSGARRQRPRDDHRGRGGAALADHRRRTVPRYRPAGGPRRPASSVSPRPADSVSQ